MAELTPEEIRGPLEGSSSPWRQLLAAMEENERLQRELGGAEMTHDRLRDQRDEALTGKATLEGIVRRLRTNEWVVWSTDQGICWGHQSYPYGTEPMSEAEALILKEMQQ